MREGDRVKEKQIKAHSPPGPPSYCAAFTQLTSAAVTDPAPDPLPLLYVPVQLDAFHSLRCSTSSASSKLQSGERDVRRSGNSVFSTLPNINSC